LILPRSEIIVFVFFFFLQGGSEAGLGFWVHTLLHIVEVLLFWRNAQGHHLAWVQQMVFSTARVHVQLMQWEEPTVIEQGLSQCDTFFDAIPQHLVPAPLLPPFMAMFGK
jgi:hypothetical protein